MRAFTDFSNHLCAFTDVFRAVLLLTSLRSRLGCPCVGRESYFSIAIPQDAVLSACLICLSYLHTSCRTGNLTSALLSCFSTASKNWLLRNWLHFSIYLHICFAREGCSNDSTVSVLTALQRLTLKDLNQRRVSARQITWSSWFCNLLPVYHFGYCQYFFLPLYQLSYPENENNVSFLPALPGHAIFD